jgi:hypothetical protein
MITIEGKTGTAPIDSSPEPIKDLVTPNISACRKIDNTLLIKVQGKWKRKINMHCPVK